MTRHNVKLKNTVKATLCRLQGVLRKEKRSQGQFQHFSAPPLTETDEKLS